MPPAFPTVFRNSRPAIQVQTTRVAYQKSTSGQRFRTVFPPGALFSLLNPTPGLTEKGDSAFMQSHSCQLKSGLYAHMTGRSFSLHGPPASIGLPLPGKKAKFPATYPCSPRRRRVPTGDPRKTLYIHCKQRSPCLKIDFQAGASCIFVGSILLPAPAENGAKRIFQRLSDLLFQMIKFIRVEKLCKRDT